MSAIIATNRNHDQNLGDAAVFLQIRYLIGSINVTDVLLFGNPWFKLIAPRQQPSERMPGLDMHSRPGVPAFLISISKASGWVMANKGFGSSTASCRLSSLSRYLIMVSTVLSAACLTSAFGSNDP